MANLTIEHFNNTNASKATESLSITKNSVVTEVSVNSVTYKFKISLTSTFYKKKVFQPHEVIAIIKLENTKTKDEIFPSADIISQLFLGKKVSVNLDGAGVSTNLFVHKVLPKVKSGEIELRLEIFSLDKLMTLDKYSQAYSGRKLRKELLMSADRFGFSYGYYTEENNVPKSQIAQISVTPDRGKTENSADQKAQDTTQLQHLAENVYTTQYKKDNKTYTYTLQNEFIHPYLVQYNESFYDFLVRISNRCGEFFYFEDGVLKIGLSQTVDYTNEVTFKDDNSGVSKNLYGITNLSSVKEISGYTSVEMANSMSGVFSVESFHRNSLAEKNEISSSSKKANHGDVSGGYSVEQIYKDTGSTFKVNYPSDTNFDKSGYFYNSEIAHDEFFMPLYKDGFGGDKFVELDRGSAGKQISHAVEQVLNSTSLFDLLSNAAIEYASIGILYGMYYKVMDDRGKERFIQPNAPSNSTNINGTTFTKEPDVVVPFSENSVKRWTTLEYYSDIRYFQDLLGKQMIRVDMGSNLADIKLGEIIKISALGSDSYVVTEVNTQIDDTASTQEFYAIPLLKFVFDSVTYYAAYPPVIEGEVFRKSGPQTAFVVDAADPKRQGRVRIRYPWQTKEDNIPVDSAITIPKGEEAVWERYNKMRKEAATPWVRMVMPAASGGGSGIYFEAEPGDEVLVNFENDNVERPYVVGSLYSKNHLAPVGKGRRVLLSKFGHMIRFKDPSDGVGEISDSTGLVRVFSSFLPLLDTFSFWFGNLIPNFDKTTKYADMLTGGIDIGDAFGMYKISTSSDERAIKIASPFGDISLSAFSGITIKAPNGNIKIEGKNIDLVASNKVNITSGVNLKKRSWWSGGLGADSAGETLGNVASKFGDKLVDTLGAKLQIIDFDLIRTLMEVVIRPVNGTLSLKSYGFITMEAGEGEAQIPREAYTDRYKKKLLNLSDTEFILDGYAEAERYIDYVKLSIDTHFSHVRLMMETVNAMINKFIDDYISQNTISDISSRDALVDALFEVQPRVFGPGNISIRKRNELISEIDVENIEMEEVMERRNEIFKNFAEKLTREYYAIHHILHTADNGLLDVMKLDYLKNHLPATLGAETDPKFLDLLKNHISQTYNAREFYFHFCSDVNNVKSLFKQGLTGAKFASLSNQKKYLIRILIKNFFNDYKKVLPDYIVEAVPITGTVTSDNNWNIFANSIKFTRDRFAVTNYLRKKLGDYVNDFQESISTWTDTPGEKGKIVISDNAANSWHSDGSNNSFIKYNNRPQYTENLMNTAKTHLANKLTSI